MRNKSLRDPYADRPPVKHIYLEEPKDIWEAIRNYYRIIIRNGRYEKIWLCFKGNCYVYVKEAWGRIWRSSTFSTRESAELFYNNVEPHRLWLEYKSTSEYSLS